MALTQEETQDMRDALALLSGEELRAQLGDDPDADKIINELLENGKQVELKAGPVVVEGEDDDEQRPPATKQPKAEGEDDDDDDDDDDDGATGFVDAHGNPVPDPNAQPAAPAQAAQQAAADAAAAAEAEQQAAAQAQAVQIAPPDLSVVDARYQEQLTALDATKAEKFQQLMNGEIEPGDYAKFESQYLNDRDALKADKQAMAGWLGDIHAFKVKALADSGVNYDDPKMGDAWDTWVKHLAATKPGQPDSWYLEEAHKKVMVEFDLAPKAAKPAPATPQNVAPVKKVAKSNVRAPNLDGIPPTLGAVPSAVTVDGNDGGEFAHLDNLTGIALERAIAGMTAEQRDRWSMQ